MDDTTGAVLWRPTEDIIRNAALTRFAQSVGLPDASYQELWQWSVTDLEQFWTHAVDFLGVRWRVTPDRTLASAAMPGAQWFPGGQLSFAEHVFADKDPESIAVRFLSEASAAGEWTWADLRRETAVLRAALISHGVKPGDRVAAYLPNIPHTLSAFLAVASLGAVWTAVAPEFGADAVIARFRQTRPKVLLGVDGYRFKGTDVDREQVGRQIAEHVGATYLRFGLLDGSGWDAPAGASDANLEFEAVPFDHPLWVLYSSGTTGQPKAIVHGHGGALLELLKTGVLQMDLKPEDRVFWFTTTGWVMWNVMLAPLLAGASVVLYDGNPDPDALWDLAASSGATFFGTSAAWLDSVRRSGANPLEGRDLSALRAIGSTGSPLPLATYDWVYEAFPASTWLVSISGGTDIVTPFLGLAPTVPVHRGELGPPALGVDLQSWNEVGTHAVGRLGELVVAQPMPSMPVMFWNDPDNNRLRESYYERFPGAWAHGDWIMITDRLTGVITGRSDATINRGGVRIGTAEIYDGLRSVPEVQDALAVDVPRPGSHGELVLFVVTDPEHRTDETLVRRVRTALRVHCSPRHVPDIVVLVDELPTTASGKKLEIPIKRILMGENPETVVTRNNLANPHALDAIAAMDLWPQPPAAKNDSTGLPRG